MKHQILFAADLMAATFAQDLHGAYDAPADFLAKMKMRTCVVCSVDNPAPDFPTFVTGLNGELAILRGGVSWVAFMRCEIVFTDITSVTEWNAKIKSRDIVILQDCTLTGNVTTEPNFVTVGSCRKQVVTDRSHSLILQDISDNSNYDRALFWIHMQENPSAYKMAYATCDGVLYPFNSVDVNPNRNTAESTEAFTQWDVTITYNKLTNDMPVILSGGDTIADIIYPA